MRSIVLAAVLMLTPGAAFAQTETPPPEAAALAAPVSTVRIPAGTLIYVELTEPLSSETSQQQQTFGLRLADPIIVDGQTVVPAGVAGGGEVIDAAPSSFGGRQGRLILSGRFLEIGGQRARLRALQLSAVGEHRGNDALAVSMVVGIPAFFIQGGEVNLPVGTRASARLATDVEVALEAPVQIASNEAAAPPALEQQIQPVEGEQ